MPNFLRTLGRAIARAPFRSLLMLAAAVLVALYLLTPVVAGRRAVQQQAGAGHFRGTVPAQDAALVGGVSEARREVARLQEQLAALKVELERTRAERGMLDGLGKPTLDEKQVKQLLHDELAALSRLQRDARQAAAPDVSTPPMQIVLPNRTPTPPPAVVPEAPPPAPAVRLPAGSIAGGRQVNGFASLANQHGVPATIVLDTDFVTPNDAVVPLRDCHLVASGTPEDVLARATFALERLSCVLPSGQHVEQTVTGWVTAADNVNGAFATVFYNDREILKFFGQAAIPATLVSLFRETRELATTATALGVVTESGAVVAQRIAGRMANLLLDRATPFLVPVVWVPENRTRSQGKLLENQWVNF